MSAEYLAIMERDGPPPSGTLVIESVEVSGIPKLDYEVPLIDHAEADRFVRISSGGKTLMVEHQINKSQASWTIEQELPLQPGGRLIVELFDYEVAASNKFVGSCLLPLASLRPGVSTEFQGPLRLDVLERSTVVERPFVKVRCRLK